MVLTNFMFLVPMRRLVAELCERRCQCLANQSSARFHGHGGHRPPLQTIQWPKLVPTHHLSNLLVALATSISSLHAEEPHDDTRLVQLLLEQNLGERRFAFPTIVRATSGKEVIPLDRTNPTHQRLLSHIEKAVAETLADQSKADAPVRQLRRINEASRYFEDGIMEKLDAIDGVECKPAPTVAGNIQRSGYPDLRLRDESTGTIFYLDPKLIQQGSDASTFRTFYFEPKTETLKITDDAVHLILAIEHDGKAQEWTFTGWRVACLSKLSVRLKAEFQASNADLYGDSTLSKPQAAP